jgi:hypothetical protein
MGSLHGYGRSRARNALTAETIEGTSFAPQRLVRMDQIHTHLLSALAVTPA